MKIILVPLVWLMLPVAFVFVAFDIAKAAVEKSVEAKLKENNHEPKQHKDLCDND